jgi:hypothetical protein
VREAGKPQEPCGDARDCRQQEQPEDQLLSYGRNVDDRDPSPHWQRARRNHPRRDGGNNRLDDEPNHREQEESNRESESDPSGGSHESHHPALCSRPRKRRQA